MKFKDMQHPERQEVVITIRVTRTQKRWIDRNRINPSLVFRKALNDLIQNSIGGVF